VFGDALVELRCWYEYYDRDMYSYLRRMNMRKKERLVSEEKGTGYKYFSVNMRWPVHGLPPQPGSAVRTP
jgi:hypothetical protein